MDFPEKHQLIDPASGDCLAVLRFLGFDIFKPMLIRFSLGALAFSLLLLIVVHVYFFLYEMTVSEIINFSPALFFIIYGFNVLVTIPWKHPDTTRAMKTLKFWSMDCASEKVGREIRKECRTASLYCFFQLFIAMMVAIFYSRKDETEREIYLIYYVIGWFFPHHYNMLTMFIKIGCVPTVFGMTVHGFQLIYFSKHVQFQMKMLNEHVRNISSSASDAACDESMVSHRLKLCSLHYIEVRRAIHLVNKSVGVSLVTFAVTGGLLGICIGFYLFENTVQASTNMYLLTMCGFVLFVSVFIGVIGSGQSVEEQPKQILDALLENEWYLWSHKNKMEFLIFLSQAMQPLRMEYSGCISLDYSLGLKIIKGIYSTLSVLLRSKKV